MSVVHRNDKWRLIKIVSRCSQRGREFVSREKQRGLLQRTARACAGREGEKNTNTGQVARTVVLLCAKRCMRVCSVSNLCRTGAVSACDVNRVASSSSPPSFYFDFLLFVLGKEGECSCFWDDVPMLVAEVYKACGARWTDT